MNFGSLFAIAFAGFIASSEAGSGKYQKKMVIPDGFGPALENITRNWIHWNNNATIYLPVDKIMMGQIRTRSSDSYIPDSVSIATLVV
ncbi:hypothetical protein RUND412_002846 [Rhizina undulata]